MSSVDCIVALDLSLSATGWAIAKRGQSVAFGLIVPVEGPHPGDRLLDLQAQLTELLDDHAVGADAEGWWEQPIAPAAGLGLAPTIASWACDTVVKMALASRRVRAVSQHMAQTRLHVLGHGRLDITKEQKASLSKAQQKAQRRILNKNAALAWCRSLGFDVYSDDIADALILCEYAANCQDWSIGPSD